MSRLECNSQSSRYTRSHRRSLRLSVALGGLNVAIHALAPLVALLRLDRERGDRPRLEPAQRDWLAGLLAVAVGAVVDARQRGVDLGDQLALPVAGAQLDGPVGLRGGAVGEIRMILVLGLEMRQRLLGLLEDVLSPDQSASAEVLALPLAHERLFVGRPVVLLVQDRDHGVAVPVLQSRAIFLFFRRHRSPRTDLRNFECDLPGKPLLARRAYIAEARDGQ